LFPEFRKPQRFGTQGQCVGKYNWQPFKLENTDNLNEIRSKYGLSTFGEYKNIMDKFCPSDEA